MRGLNKIPHEKEKALKKIQKMQVISLPLHPNHIKLPLHPNHMENQTSHMVYLIATPALRDGGNFLAISAYNR
jgi:hypothetical protein